MDNNSENKVLEAVEEDGRFRSLDHEPLYTTGQVAKRLNRRIDMVGYWYAKFEKYFPDAIREAKETGRQGRVLFSEADIAVLTRIFALKDKKRSDDSVIADLSDTRTKKLLEPGETSAEKLYDFMGSDPEFKEFMTQMVEAGVNSFVTKTDIVNILKSTNDRLMLVDNDKINELEKKNEELETKLDEANKSIAELENKLEEAQKKKGLFSIFRNR